MTCNVCGGTLNLAVFIYFGQQEYNHNNMKLSGVMTVQDLEYVNIYVIN